MERDEPQRDVLVQEEWFIEKSPKHMNDRNLFFSSIIMTSDATQDRSNTARAVERSIHRTTARGGVLT